MAKKYKPESISDKVLDLIAPATPEAEREKQERASYIDSVLKIFDPVAYNAGFYRIHS